MNSDPTPRLIIVSIDGLRPSAYLDPSSPAPVLRSLAGRGAFARGSTPVYPSVTMTNHVSLVTGTRSQRHGIYGNTILDPARLDEWRDGESKEWYRDASTIQTPVLWDIARQAGLKTAILHWPVSVGADVDWLVPEIFALPRDEGTPTWELLRRHSTPALFAELTAALGEARDTDDHAEIDDWLARAAIHLTHHQRPNLLLAHFSSYDHEMHEFGREHPRAREALRRLDRSVGSLMETIDLASTHLFVVGDHGFLDFTRRIHLNSLFRERGWLDVAVDGTIRGWRAIAHTNCGQAFIYVREPALQPAVAALLADHAAGRFRILDRATLDRLGACPRAFCAVDAAEGFSMGQNLSGDWVEDIGRTRGEHGYLAEGQPKLDAGLLMLGPRLVPGRDLGHVDLIDIAPTAAAVLGLALPAAEGVSLLDRAALRSSTLR